MGNGFVGLVANLVSILSISPRSKGCAGTAQCEDWGERGAPMDSTYIAAATFACACAGAAVGFLIRRRLREHHLTAASQEVLKLTLGVVATLAALVLGLLVGGTKQFYDAKVNEVRTFVVNIALFDRSMSHYEPSLLAERRHLNDFTRTMIGGLWGGGQ